MPQHFTIISVFPEACAGVTRYGVTGRAFDRGLAELACINPRDFATDRHRSVDDTPYGGGPGMVMMVEPWRAAIDAARRRVPGTTAHVAALSPQGQRLDEAGVMALGEHRHLVLVAGRFEGFDERLCEHDFDSEWSIGDYVLSGGELPAQVIIDALVRRLPGALGDETSAEAESFATGLLDHPHYTRPEAIDGQVVPEALRSGNHGEIARWRRRMALGRTLERRPDLLDSARLSAEDRALLQEYLDGSGGTGKS